MSYERYAIYYLPPTGPLAAFGARWLGWDVERGCAVDGFDLPGREAVTLTPRKYGFHGTLKPPFRLRKGTDQAGLVQAVADLAARLPAARCDALALSALGRFLALTPVGAAEGISQIASACVQQLDPFRAPASEDELARRRSAGLTPRQEMLLTQWGYPYVGDEFRFHLTLTGRLPQDAVGDWQGRLSRYLPPLPAPFVMDQIALCGAGADGRFALLKRYDLTA